MKIGFIIKTTSKIVTTQVFFLTLNSQRFSLRTAELIYLQPFLSHSLISAGYNFDKQSYFTSLKPEISKYFGKRDIRVYIL
jgi:hypothetical protein